ncbi:hypothetical protein [Kordia sp.]|uniref:hypothetical protein n=1 Tax=Kordia sp. TaxID=1965332 RepID=UPI003D6AB5D9
MTNTFKLILGILITSFVFTNCASDEKKKRTIPVNSIAEITTVLSPTVEKFEVKVNEETILKGKKGTSIYIPANTFQFEDGTTPTAAVTIEIKECYSLTDMIFEDLQTTSKDQILETNGMIYLNAESNGKKLSVKEGKAVVIGFPKKNADKEMDLFYEVQLNDSTKTWIPNYELFEFTAERAANTTDGEGDSFYNIEYPIEMTDDLYYYGYSPYTWTSRFDRIQFKGTNKTIIDYIETLKDIDSTDAYLFYKNNWYINLDFNIDKNGKMHNFKPRFYSDEKYNEQAIKITTELFKSLPLIDLDESNSDWRFSLGISSKRMLNKEKFKQKFREKYANYTNTAIEKIDPNALEYYMFSATEMGWINCDRFWDVDANEKTDFIVKTTNPKETKIRIIFKDIKSIMTGTYENGVLVFKNIPKEKEIKVIGISYANGKPTLSVETATTDTENFELTNFKEFSLDELETELNSLQ